MLRDAGAVSMHQNDHILSHSKVEDIISERASHAAPADQIPDISQARSRKRTRMRATDTYEPHEICDAVAEAAMKIKRVNSALDIATLILDCDGEELTDLIEDPDVIAEALNILRRYQQAKNRPQKKPPQKRKKCSPKKPKPDGSNPSPAAATGNADDSDEDWH